MQNHTTDSFTKNIEAIVMGVLMFFVSFTFGSVAHAEEVASDTGNTDRAALVEKLQQMRADLQALRGENKSLSKEVAIEKKDEKKVMIHSTAEEFRASIVDLSPEEKRAAVIEFVTQLKANAETLRAKHEAARTERQTLRQEDRSAFHDSLESLTPQEKMEALRARLDELLGRAADNNDKLNDALDGSEDEVDDESDDTDEAETELSDEESEADSEDSDETEDAENS